MIALATQDPSFRFLFREDQGRIGRRTWWTGTLGLGAVLAALTGVWLFASRGATGAFDSTQAEVARTVIASLCLILFAAGILLIAVCHTMLSAKRLNDRARPAGLAGVLPLAALLTGAAHWLQPRMEGAMPGWSLWVADGSMAAVVVWVVAEMGVLAARAKR